MKNRTTAPRPLPSKGGPTLRETLAQRIGIIPKWNYLDDTGIVHQYDEFESRRYPEMVCGRGFSLVRPRNDTRAQITCLSCVAGYRVVGWAASR